MKRTPRRKTFFLLFVCAASLCVAQQRYPVRKDWPVFGGDPENTKYSPLDQINKNNVQELQIAWTWKITGKQIPEKGILPEGIEATPIMIDDVLYLSTGLHRVIALDANTGRELWSYDPHTYEMGPGRLTFTHRGVATWATGNHRRVFINARGRLIALDAKNGQPITDFGHDGEIDMTQTLGREIDRLQYANTSPPVVYKNIIMSGSTVWDGWIDKDTPPGDVQAFDTRTGKHLWSFHTIPREGEYGTETWENDAWRWTGHANVWMPFTLDSKRGLVYLPVSTPSNDHYGGNRKGNTLFADSLVCLDANTGKRVWHFQAIHHNLWDYDGVGSPVLVTIHVDGKTIDAVAAVSKTGFTYVFDRVTGKPVWPIEERPVPQTDAPGEQTSPTQPFPTKPPPFAKQGVTPDDIVDFTPEIRAMAMEKLKGYRFGPIFNPPSLQGTLMLPSNGGGANWGSASVDPETGILYVKPKNNLRVIKLIPQDPNTPHDPDYGEGVTQGAYKYNFPVNLTIADGLLLNKPPYGPLTAIDLNKGEILWQVPVGDIPAIRSHPIVKQLNLPPMGGIDNAGSMVTRGGLVFIGVGDNNLYAVEKTTGKVLWGGDLQSTSSGSPMTYQTRSGRQFVVLATKGKSATVVAFALPAGR